MRPLTRSIATLVAVAALALAGASSTLAAAPTNIPLDANFCITDGAREFCFDIKGSMRFVDSAAGSQIELNKLTRTTAYENGVEVGSALSTTSGRQAVEADGTVVIQSVVHTRSTLGDEPCSYRLVIRLVDFGAVVLHEDAGCL